MIFRDLYRKSRSGRFVLSGRQDGVPGSSIPATGSDGRPTALYSRLNLPADASRLFRIELETAPVGLDSFWLNEDSSYGGTGPNGSYSFTYRLAIDAVDQGSTVVNFTIGATAPAPLPPPPPPLPNPGYGTAWLSSSSAGGGGGGLTVRRSFVLGLDDLDLSALPDELQGGGAADVERELVARSLKIERLTALGQTIAELRDAAVKARAESGIEKVWMACEEAYLCIDDLNRHEFSGAAWAKPVSMNGPLVAEPTAPADGRSTVFVRLTPRYVDMGAAKVCEVQLSVDDKAFSLKPSPVPSLVDPRTEAPPMPQLAAPGMQGMPPVPGMPPANLPPALAALAAQRAKEKQAQEAAERAEQRIYDWMIEANYPAQMRKVLHDAARIGVGVLKGPFPETRESMALDASREDVLRIKLERRIAPSCKWIDPWNLFPHPACGENVHDGDYIFERDFISAKTLRDMKDERDSLGAPVYLSAQIDQVLKEGPNKGNDEGRNPNDPKNKDRFEIWYFYGTLTREQMQSADMIGVDDLPDELHEAPAIITIVNDSVIRCTMNPLNSGRFPYNTVPWSRRAGHWAGVGVAEQVNMAQRSANAGTRAVFNNAGVSAGVQIVLDPLGVVPADGSRVLTPNKLWYKTADATADDVRKLFAAIEMPNITAQLMPIVQYAFKLAEEACNIPLISQGQDGPTTPQTFGAAELQNHNANTLLRHMAYNTDDHITEPLVTGFYEWLLLDPSVPLEEKGDFQINAQGSIAMVEKAIQEQTLVMMAGMVVNPAFGADPAKWFEEVLKAKRIDPRRILLSDEDKAQRAQMPPPEPPQITAAKIRAQADAQATQMRLQFEQGAEQFRAQQQMQLAQQANQARLQAAQMTTDATLRKMRADTDRDTLRVSAENERTKIEYDATMRELAMRERIAMLDYANKNSLKLSDVKAQLAKQAMSIQATKELAAMEVSADRLPQPPVEPPGRAQPGHSFQE